MKTPTATPEAADRRTEEHTTMRPIIVKDSNRDRIMQVIGEAEGRATTRLMTWDLLQDNVAAADAALEGMPKRAQVGATALATTGEEVARSYNRGYGAQETHVRLERRPSGWAIVEAFRGDTAHGHLLREVHITAEQEREMLMGLRLQRRLTVRG